MKFLYRDFEVNITIENMSDGEKIFHVSTFKPEKCGIAYWTEDKINYLQKIDPGLRNRVVAVNGFRDLREYTDHVEIAFERDSKESYIETAQYINNNPDARAVWIEHEFGIFGGDIPENPGSRNGHYLLDFLYNLKKPVGITCHTILGEEDNPSVISRRKTLNEILQYVNEIVVISETSRNILLEQYDVNPDKITSIYHGAHEFGETPEEAKQILDLEDKFVISTTGLVRRKRGMEFGIRALPEIVDKHPDTVYVIAGATHPKEMEGDREPYREELEEEVRKLDLEDNVIFVNKSLPLTNLLRYIQASDIGLTLYDDPRQVSSGVLSYNVALGKPVISSPFHYSKEILGEGRGIVLPDFHNPNSVRDALLSLLENPSEIEKIKRNIEPIREKMKWPNVAKTYYDLERKLIEGFS